MTCRIRSQNSAGIQSIPRFSRTATTSRFSATHLRKLRSHKRPRPMAKICNHLDLTIASWHQISKQQQQQMHIPAYHPSQDHRPRHVVTAGPLFRTGFDRLRLDVWHRRCIMYLLFSLPGLQCAAWTTANKQTGYRERELIVRCI